MNYVSLIKGRGSILVLTLSITVGGVITPSFIGGTDFSVQTAYAAETQDTLLSKEEALKLAKTMVDIPAGYKEEDIRLDKTRTYSEYSNAT